MEEVREALRRCVALGRELTGLERLLDIDRDLATVASYPLPPHGRRGRLFNKVNVSLRDERRRLGLGLASLPDIAELLETQDVRTAQVPLPDDISGLTLIEPAIGFLVVANRDHHVVRRPLLVRARVLPRAGGPGTKAAWSAKERTATSCARSVPTPSPPAS